MAISYPPSAPVNNRPLRLIRNGEAPHDGDPPRREPFAMIPHWVIERHGATIGPYGLAAYSALAYHADQSGVSWPSYGTIARLMGMTRRQAIRAVAVLAEVGLIRVEARDEDGRGHVSNRYTLVNDSHQGSDSQSPGLVTDSHHPSDSQSPELEPVNKKNENGEIPPSPRRNGHAYPAEFERRFWDRYPSGRGTKKKAADRWGRLSAGDRDDAVAGLDKWLASDQWRRDAGRFVPYAERYLGDRIWENDPPPPVPPPPSPGPDRRGVVGPDYFVRMAEDLKARGE